MIMNRTTLVLPVTFDIRLRRARPMDAYPITQLMRRALGELSGDHYSPQQIASMMDEDLTPDMQLIKDGTYFVIESRGQIIACGGWSRYSALYNGDTTNGGEHELSDQETGSAKIRLMFVDPDFTRRGLGTMLLETSMFDARMEGFNRFELLGTLTAEGLYQRMGFVTLEVINYTDSNGVVVPLVRMEKSVS